MIEDYGTLSEEELLQEITDDLVERDEIDISDLEMKFNNGKLKVTGSLKNEEELEAFVAVLENYVDPKEYDCEVELHEGQLDSITNLSSFDGDDEEQDEEEYFEDELEEVGEDGLGFEDDGDFGDDKW